MEPNTVEFLERLLSISRIMAENRDPDSLLEFAMQSAMELVNAEQGHLILLTDTGSLNFHVSKGASDEVSHSVLKRVLENQEPLRITDALSSEDFKGAPSIQDFQLRSIMCVPLISRNRMLGVVYVENRSHSNIFLEPHLDVLVFFAKQAAVLIENAMLVANLQKTREQLVTTREEERRRIRRKLHNELGPSLAALRLELDTSQNLLTSDAVAAEDLLDKMQGEVEGILTNVRRIIYELRPPSLDELGLISTIEEYIATCRRSSDLQFELVVPDDLPPLSAAVEVAIYHITLEAITNVIRHAQASYCHIYLGVEDGVMLEIQNDGQADDALSEDGISIIRQRVAELGGTLKITSNPDTSVAILLPLTI